MADEFRDGVVVLLPKLRAYANVLVGSAQDGDDLVQDALVRAWRYRDTFRPGTNLKAWLFRVLRNEFLSQLRKTRRRPAMSVADIDGVGCEPDQEWRRSYREVLLALDALQPSAREALLLVGGSGLSYEEAAVVVGCAVGTIKSRVSRARDQLGSMVDYEPQARRPAASASGGGLAADMA